jgi:hypothetical protein
MLLSYAGRFDEAESDLMAYCEQSDDDLEASVELAMNAFRAGRMREASAQACAARERGADQLQLVLIEAMSLWQDGRERDVPDLVEHVAARHFEDPKLLPLVEWLAGRRSDAELLEWADDNSDRGGGGACFWLGTKLRLGSETAKGTALIRRSLEISDTGTYEYEHALAMLNGGRL